MKAGRKIIVHRFDEQPEPDVELVVVDDEEEFPLDDDPAAIEWPRRPCPPREFGQR